MADFTRQLIYNMTNPNTEINLKKYLLDENRSKLKKMRITQIIVALIIFLVIVGCFAYQNQNQNRTKKIPVEVLPNTSLNKLNQANPAILESNGNLNNPIDRK